MTTDDERRIKEIDRNMVYAYASITRMQRSIDETRKYIAAQRQLKAALLAGEPRPVAECICPEDGWLNDCPHATDHARRHEEVMQLVTGRGRARHALP